MLRQCCGIAALGLLVPLSAAAETRCEHVLKALAAHLADATCVESPDLTTNNPDRRRRTIRSCRIASPFAFTPRTDRDTISPPAGQHTPITKVVPGMQIRRDRGGSARSGRFVLRLPNDWNGKLVVAGASGTRSEFNGDFAWSDYVVQQGYAYASQNKGMLNLYFPRQAQLTRWRAA